MPPTINQTYFTKTDILHPIFEKSGISALDRHSYRIHAKIGHEAIYICLDSIANINHENIAVFIR